MAVSSIALKAKSEPQANTVKKDLTEVLLKHKIITKDTFGQINMHLNSGGVSKIMWVNLEINA